jgi:acetyl-CoA C-acetyltransferase
MESTSIDPRTPVIVGAGQLNDREYGSEPIDLMTRCAEAAFDDTESSTLIDKLDAVRVVWGVWPYKDPGRLVAERLGKPEATTTITAVGGNQVYDLVSDTADRIQAGDLDVAVVCGAESMRTRRSDRARGTATEYLAERTGAAADDFIGHDRELSSHAEKEIGIDVVVRFYAMAETALRHRLGETIGAHRNRIAELWSRASAVATQNPNAWSQQATSAEEIATESASNRPVCSPYPKLMTSNLNVDQGGAVVMCSAAAADRAGISRDHWVFPWSSARASDHWFPTNRWAFDESPAMRLTGERTLKLANLSLDDCGLIDLYSCFPVAVQLAQRELGLSPDRDFTITGGLTFAAGPLNCYCLLPLTKAVRLLRESQHDKALLTGNGGSFTKHSAIVMSKQPPPQRFRSVNVQTEVDQLPARPSPTQRASIATLETYTVTYDRDMQPEEAIMACLDNDGGRHWAQTSDSETMNLMIGEDLCGSSLALTENGAQLT